MPKMNVTKERLEGKPPVEAGIYDIRLDDFSPKLAKSKDSTNLYPDVKVINHATHNDRTFFIPLNQNAGWIIEAFCHCFGLPMEEVGDGSKNIPGDFVPDPGDPDNVAKLKYTGPLLGRTGRIVVAVDKNNKNRDQNVIRQFICAVPGCSIDHPKEMK